MPDAVVIGAGPNGLVAANVLVDAGWSVEVLEAREEPGGAVRSDRGVRPDYVSDLFSAFYPLAAASPVLARLDLAAEGLRWSHAPRVLAHSLRDGGCAVLERRVQDTAAAGSGGFGWLMSMLGQSHGFPVPVGGAGALTAALVSCLQRHGGSLRCGERVASVVVRGGGLRPASRST